jgi:GT2 family glycosyltransferase
MNLLIITVNYGNTSPTETFLTSLSKCELDDSVKIAIADNKSSKATLLNLNKKKDELDLDIEIFPYLKNHYYWPASKKIFSSYIKNQNSFPDWVLICNNDIIFTDSNFFKKLKKIDIKKYPIIGPKIIDSSGKNSNPFMIKNLTKLEKFFWDFYFISYHLSIVIRKIRKLCKLFYNNKLVENEILPKKVYAIHGSAMIFSKDFFLKGGTFDNNFEMYGEEISVAKIAKEINLPVTFFPELELKHNEHTNTKNTNNRLLFEKAKFSHKYNY